MYRVGAGGKYDLIMASFSSTSGVSPSLPDSLLRAVVGVKVRRG